MLRSELDASVQQLDALFELAQIDVAEAEVVKEIGVTGLFLQQFLQVYPGFIKPAGLYELQGFIEVVCHPQVDQSAIIKMIAPLISDK